MRTRRFAFCSTAERSFSVASSFNLPTDTILGFPNPNGKRDGTCTKTDMVVSGLRDRNAGTPGAMLKKICLLYLESLNTRDLKG